MALRRIDPPAHPAVWRAAQAGPPPTRVLPAGHAELAAYLPGQGWPYHCLIEFLVQRPGWGEAALLQPALAQVAGQAPILLVQPPHPPCHQGWLASWPPGARLWWLQPATASDTLWALNQAVRSGACGAVLAWLPQATELALRRLHLAAQSAATLLVVVRPWACHQQGSPAPLRLGLKQGGEGLEVHFFKARGERPANPVVLSSGLGAVPWHRKEPRVPRRVPEGGRVVGHGIGEGVEMAELAGRLGMGRAGSRGTAGGLGGTEATDGRPPAGIVRRGG